MAKTNPIFKIESFGIYDSFNATGKSLPKISRHTALIPAQIDLEFGLTLSVKKAKGITLDWCIKHPNICDKKKPSLIAIFLLSLNSQMKEAN